MDKAEIIKALKQLVALLVSGNISKIIALAQNGRLSGDEIAMAISGYPGKMTMPPDVAFDSLHTYDVYDLETEARNVEFDLWYDGEASDLTLSVNAFKKEGYVILTIDDIHVL